MKLRDSGSRHEVDVESAPDGVPHGISAARDGNVVWVSSGGETYRIERLVARPGKKGGDVEHDLRAPMPGKVIRVFVEEGAEVAKGTALLVLEAMKMEHEIRAPGDGRVGKLLCRAGEMVGLGDVLVEMA